MILFYNSDKNTVNLVVKNYVTKFEFKCGHTSIAKKFVKVMAENIYSITDVGVSYYDTKNELNTSVSLNNVAVILPNDTVVAFETIRTDCAIKLAHALEQPNILLYANKISRKRDDMARFSDL